MLSHIYLQWCFSWLTRPYFCLWFIPLPFACINHSLYLLGDPPSDACGANIHPLSSQVSYQLFSPCCLTRPEDTPQIKLHIMYIDDITTSAAPSDTIPSQNKSWCQDINKQTGFPPSQCTYCTHLAGFLTDDTSPWVLSSIHIQRPHHMKRRRLQLD